MKYYIVFFVAQAKDGLAYGHCRANPDDGLLKPKTLVKQLEKDEAISNTTITNFIEVSKEQYENW
jgi:hypothetical protein